MASSPLTGLRWSHVRLVAGYWARFSLRTGGGLMCILVVLIVGLVVASTFVTPVEAMLSSANESGHSEQEMAWQIDKIAQSEQVVDAIQWITGDEENAEYMLKEQPALLSGILLLFLMFFPFLACQAGFNQTSGDIGNRGLRYLLLRTERVNIFLGRFLGSVMFLTFSSILLFAILLLYVGAKFEVYSWGAMTLWMGQGLIACIALAMPHLAICAWISAAIDSPFGALTLCFLIIGFPIALLKVADTVTKTDMSWLERLLPWGWKYDLLSGDLGERFLAFGMMFVFTAVFLTIGVRYFHRRDL